jgi:integrase
MNNQPRRLKKIKGVNLFEVTIKGRQYWRVVSPKPGQGRLSRTFGDRIEARNYYEQQVQLTRNLGRAGGGLSARQRLDAIAALETLAPFDGVSLLSAAQAYARHHVSLSSSVTVTEAIAKLLQAKVADKASKRYYEGLRHYLNRFASDFGDSKIAEITSADVGDWLRGLRLSPSSRNTAYMRLSVLFAYAVERRWAFANPLSKSMRVKEPRSEPGIISPEEFASLLSNASADLRPYWVLAGFCGIRRAEIQRLEWRDIKWEGRVVEINPLKSKTASRRLVDLCDAALAWLAPYRTCTGSICPTGLHERLVADRTNAGIESWPGNALRHSYASYHLAHYKDAPALSLQMGHVGPNMLFKHYRERVLASEAAKWWAIYPNQGSNVIQIAS